MYYYHISLLLTEIIKIIEIILSNHEDLSA
jgi:hypothetical protein